MWGLVYISIFLFSLLLSLLLTPLAGKTATFFKVLDYPDERKIHSFPKPLLGGVAIYLSFSFTILLGVFFGKTGLARFLPFSIQSYLPGIISVLPKLSLILIGGLIILCFGLIDDLIGLRPGLKLSGQIAIGICLFLVGIRITLFISNPLLSAIITILWLITIINAFNLLDNMDGLSVGVAVIASFLFFLVAISNGEFFISTILAVFLGSLLGFLRYNFYPAKIFMGEAGTSFIGYLLATIAILGTYYQKETPSFLPVIGPLLILGLPLFDMAGVVVIRIKNKKSIFRADKNHLSHRLVNLGMSQRKAVLFIYLAAFSLGLGALLLGKLSLLGGLLIVLQALTIITIIVLLEITGRNHKNNIHHRVTENTEKEKNNS